MVPFPRQNLGQLPKRSGLTVACRAKTMLDVSSSYPNTEDFCNISKETTWRELCKIRNIPEDVQRAAGINLTGGVTNAVEIAVSLFGVPTFDTLLDDFMNPSTVAVDMI